MDRDTGTQKRRTGAVSAKRNSSIRVRRKKRSAYLVFGVFVAFCALLLAFISLMPSNRRHDINGITLRGELTEELVMGEATYYYIVPGERFTFDMQMKYTDSSGKTAYGPPLDKTEIAMIFSDTSLCERTAYNQILVNEEVDAGTTFTVKTIFKKKEVLYTFFVALNTQGTLDENGYVTNASNLTALVSWARKVPYDYVPALTTPGIKFVDEVGSFNKQLRPEASSAAERMFTAAKNDGYVLIARFCYDNGSDNGYEHMLGLAMDITCANTYYNDYSFSSTGEYRWLVRNAYKYGFILRYEEDKTSVTGMGYDPEHFRYVGSTLAQYLYTNGLCLEEVTIDSLEGN